MKRCTPPGAVVLVLGLAVVSQFATAALVASSLDSAREKRLAWWHEAKFGLFIHWGLYSLPAGEWKGQTYSGIGEWIMYKARIPIADYEQLARQFNPVKFDADAWAQLASDAGMKYLVLTAKHHDGFALYASQADPFNIVAATPFKRDVVKELAAACARRGLKFGVYYSQAQDWTAPGGAIWEGPHEDDPVWANPIWDPRQAGDFDAYFHRKAIPQIRELLSNYGPISIVWFDTPLKVVNVERAAKLEKVVRELQPDCLISGRLGGQSQSDYDSEGDNAIPALSRAGAWETPATLNDTWGFKKNDHHWKQPEDVTFKLVDIVSKGGNYLLNVGPDGEGVIPQPSCDLLRAVGRWLRINGEAIYGAGRSPFGAEFGAYSPTRTDQRGRPAFETRREWRCTTKPGKLYVHLFKWPAGKCELTGVKDRVTKAYLLADPQRAALKVTQQGDQVTVALPETSPDPLASVLCLETSPSPPDRR
ncbi:MAG: alpha-L-fucosidase [Verrucomicrobia bacterium]|nr:alpha-L-fucosidase [Verrucomicrobiota bacterium]